MLCTLRWYRTTLCTIHLCCAPCKRGLLFWEVGVTSNIFVYCEAGEIIHLVLSICLSMVFVLVCESYIVHHLNSTRLRCAPLTCVVPHQPMLYTMTYVCEKKGSPMTFFIFWWFHGSVGRGGNMFGSVRLFVCPWSLSGFLRATLCTTSTVQGYVVYHRPVLFNMTYVFEK